MDTLAQLQAIDQTTITPLVRQALRRDSVTPIAWQVTRLVTAAAAACIASRAARMIGEQSFHGRWSSKLPARTRTPSPLPLGTGSGNC